MVYQIYDHFFMVYEIYAVILKAYNRFIRDIEVSTLAIAYFLLR
jgi:hypothetical protein